jgi:acetyltransferase-like isoleucine patch superfamily enzyme
MTATSVQTRYSRAMIRTTTAILKKSAKRVAGGFPLNGIRVRALRSAGYRVGHSVYIGEGLHVTDELFSDVCSLSIGNRVAIAQRVLIILASHPNESTLKTVVEPVFGHVVIEDDAWIGAGAIILPNVTVGEAAIVGAGAVVTKDVAPRTIVVGNPAQPLKSVDDAS